FAWFGGLIGGFAAYVAVARWKKIPLLAALDAGSPAAALGYGVGRIGCLLSGDGDYGVPTSLPWGMSFPNGMVPTTQRVHPTPIYELIVALAIAWILWKLGRLQIRSGWSGETTTRSREVRVQVAVADRVSASPQMPSEHWSARLPWLRPGSVFAAYLILTGVAS